MFIIITIYSVIHISRGGEEEGAPTYPVADPPPAPPSSISAGLLLVRLILSFVNPELLLPPCLDALMGVTLSFFRPIGRLPDYCRWLCDSESLKTMHEVADAST